MGAAAPAQTGPVCRLASPAGLPVDEPYNSFVILDNGLIVTKNLSDRHACAPDGDRRRDDATSMRRTGNALEPSIARLSAIGNTVYVVGVRSIFRYHWDADFAPLVFDDDWRFDYVGTTSTDPWLGCGARRRSTPGSWITAGTTYVIKMIGSGVNAYTQPADPRVAE
jgi:hypothetical protein